MQHRQGAHSGPRADFSGGRRVGPHREARRGAARCSRTVPVARPVPHRAAMRAPIQAGSASCQEFIPIQAKMVYGCGMSKDHGRNGWSEDYGQTRWSDEQSVMCHCYRILRILHCRKAACRRFKACLGRGQCAMAKAMPTPPDLLAGEQRYLRFLLERRLSELEDPPEDIEVTRRARMDHTRRIDTLAWHRALAEMERRGRG